jgi:hypothetical protein
MPRSSKQNAILFVLTAGFYSTLAYEYANFFAVGLVLMAFAHGAVSTRRKSSS